MRLFTYSPRLQYLHNNQTSTDTTVSGTNARNSSSSSVPLTFSAETLLSQSRIYTISLTQR